MVLNKLQELGMKGLVVFLKSRFIKGKVDTILFTKHVDSDILIIQVYIDDIIFGSTNEKLCKNFELFMKEKFVMSMMGELNYFFGLQIK